MKAVYVVIICLLGLCLKAQDAMYLVTNSIYCQDFNYPNLARNGPASPVPFGWAFAEFGANHNLTYSVGDGRDAAGDTYSYGPQGEDHNDRAFGMLRSSRVSSVIGVNFRNNLGYAITSLNISYTGEQWRLGTRTGNAPDRLSFAYRIGGGTLTDGSWTEVSALDFLSPQTCGTAGALDGNAAANRTLISYQINGLNITDGQSFWLRWSDFDNPYGNDGLAIDDFSIEFIPEPSTRDLCWLAGGILLCWAVIRRRRGGKAVKSGASRYLLA